VLREVFGPKRDEVTIDWRRMHSEELPDLYCSPKFGLSHQEDWDWRGLKHVLGRGRCMQNFGWET